MLVAFVPIEPTRVGDFPEGRLLPERCELALFYRLFKDFALICRQHCRRRLFSLFLVFWPFFVSFYYPFSRGGALLGNSLSLSLSLSLSRALPFVGIAFLRSLSPAATSPPIVSHLPFRSRARERERERKDARSADAHQNREEKIPLGMIVGALRYDAPLSLSLFSFAVLFSCAFKPPQKEKRERRRLSLFSLSLSLSRRRRRRFAKERCWSVMWFRTDAFSASLSLCYPKLQHLKPMGVEKRSRYFPFRHTFSLDRGAQKPTESHPKKTTT